MLDNTPDSPVGLPPTYLPGWHSADLVKKMRYRQLGQTDLTVSQVGFGGCVVGGVYPDKGDLEEIYQVESKMFHVRMLSQNSVCGCWTEIWD